MKHLQKSQNNDAFSLVNVFNIYFAFKSSLFMPSFPLSPWEMLHLSVCVCVHVPWHMCKGQRTTPTIQFSPFTMGI